ncbi:riboflavin synthase, partial [bacterium]
FGGHIVQGHVDATGSLVGSRPEGNSVVLRFRGPSSRYLVDKGSVAIDGVSLTVVSPVATESGEGEFDVWTIPFTLAHTTLGDLRPGDRVNLEWDEVAKWVERLTAPYS